MMISVKEAEAALAEVKQATARSAELRGYQSFAPHLMYWGLLWGIGYAVSYFAAGIAGIVWLVISLFGWTGDLVIVKIDHRRAVTDYRFFLVLLTFAAFAVGSILVMAPRGPNQVGAFIPMLIGASYVIVGVFGLPRLAWTGAGMFSLTLFGFFALPHVFLLWMAVVGGGGCVLGGLWLRRA